MGYNPPSKPHVPVDLMASLHYLHEAFSDGASNFLDKTRAKLGIISEQELTARQAKRDFRFNEDLLNALENGATVTPELDGSSCLVLGKDGSIGGVWDRDMAQDCTQEKMVDVFKGNMLHDLQTMYDRDEALLKKGNLGSAMTSGLQGDEYTLSQLAELIKAGINTHIDLIPAHLLVAGGEDTKSPTVSDTTPGDAANPARINTRQ